ncbi:MAG: polysaccharide pyruvyl transferase family protein [Deltaproteobacteria bacterium]|nr:polysaccharide pyruvyl transferase family protein [Deltaproteobacteria bacterium]
MTATPRSILIINQAWSNHGDEAAHKALVRMLRQRFPAASLTVLAFSDLVTERDLEIFRPEEIERLEYVCDERRPSVGRLGGLSAVSTGFAKWILRNAPAWRPLRARMRGADLIVSAPGGIDLGPYRNWLYLALLLLALESGTPTAIYSISFGPLPDEGRQDRAFSRLALEVLRRVDFLSLREPWSQEYARKLEIPFVEATDTAYIDATIAELPAALRRTLESPYVVVVPNELHRWHVWYRSIGAERFHSLYHALIARALESTDLVVLMPQLFARQNDSDYCNALRNDFDAADRDRIVVAPEDISVEVQKAIIKAAEMVVAARSHANIFSIHCGTPVLALSYEQKMEAHLIQAGLTDYMIRLNEIDEVDLSDVSKHFDDVWQQRAELKNEITRKAAPIRRVAIKAADEFARRFGADAASAEAGHSTPS